MADDSPAPQRDLLSSLLPTPRRNRSGGRSPLLVDSDDSDDDGPRVMNRSSPLDRGSSASSVARGGGGGSLTPSDRFRSATMSSVQRRAFTGRTRELILAKNAREASREKDTLKQHCDTLEEKIRSFESAAASAACDEKEIEQLKTEVARLKVELTEAKRSAYDVSRAAAAAAADSVSTEAHDRVRAELNEARNALDAARAAAAATQLRHEDTVKRLTAKLEVERDDAIIAAVRVANEESDARAAENDEWLQSALQERTAAATALEVGPHK